MGPFVFGMIVLFICVAVIYFTLDTLHTKAGRPFVRWMKGIFSKKSTDEKEDEWIYFKKR